MTEVAFLCHAGTFTDQSPKTNPVTIGRDYLNRKVPYQSPKSVSLKAHKFDQVLSGWDEI
jgi:hypothetical protein